ncbi:SprT-like domain-containing protein [Winogradskyella sp. UBA3174]|uniref:SprT-like domain-containing protein n=1 Tax=Winogradskyella sp. UBA3174 TaxID=1947785 RepID=UPI0025FEC420|nr:SprT-like domain-containing protein [Winogradskyella sp. UBA3174]|tara:strand:- start:1857 stop:2453 length:597 start_codon:yes stop_codon:yes gene_type:complete
MKDTELLNFIPSQAIALIDNLLASDKLVVKVKGERKTRHGDYRLLPDGKHQITVNSNLNPYSFLITLVHEIAHFEAYKTFGGIIKPHGKEWKQTFQHLMLPFLRPDIFPSELLPLMAQHFKNPKASSDTDAQLALALKQLNEPNNKSYVFQVPLGQSFKLYNGRVFKRGNKRRKRYECVEVRSGKTYLFNPNAEVDVL